MNSFELDERIDKDLKQYIIDQENKRQDLNYKKLMQGIKMSKKYLYENMPGRILNPSISDLDLESRFVLFVSSIILIAIGVFIGSNFNTNSYSLDTQKHACEKSLPRDKVCVLESYNFTIKSK